MGQFFGGVPTKPAVDKLLAEIAVRPGLEVPLEQVEGLLDLDRRQSRFTTVTMAWRNRVFREYNLQSIRSGGKVLFLTADGAVDKAMTGFRRVGRATTKVLVGAEMINPAEITTDPKRQQHQLLRRELHLLRDAMTGAAKHIAAPGPVGGYGLRLS